MGQSNDALTEVADDELAGSVPPSAADVQREAQTFRGAHVTVAPLPQPAPPIQLLDVPGGADTPFARLAGAALHARERSIALLQDWFPGYDFAGASQSTDDRRFTVLQIGGALLEHLDAIETVERIVAQHDLVGNQVSFSDGSKRGAEPERVFNPFRPAVRRLRVGPLVDALADQWTTILNGVDAVDPKISGVCEHLERVYGANVNTNVYLSYGLAEGFGPHWDNHDTIIVPVAGVKRWTVYEPVALSPLRPWVDSTVSERPVWEGTLEPGMCLIIPRGWGHAVAGSDDLAIHFTLGVNRLTVQDVLQRVVVESGFSPLLRADVAYEPNDPVDAYDRSIHDDPEMLGKTIGELATPELTGRTIATYRARMPLRLFPRLLDTWVAAGSGDWKGASMRMPVPCGVHPLLVTSVQAVVAFGGRRIDLTPEAFDVVMALADAELHPVSELPEPGGDPQIRAAICAELVRSGLAEIRFN